MPCSHDSEKCERSDNDNDDHHHDHSGPQVRAATTAGIYGSQRLRRERQLLPGRPGGEESERPVPRVHLRCQRHDQVQPQGVPAAGSALAQDEPVLFQDAVGAVFSRPRRGRERNAFLVQPSSSMVIIIINIIIIIETSTCPSPGCPAVASSGKTFQSSLTVVGFGTSRRNTLSEGLGKPRRYTRKK